MSLEAAQKWTKKVEERDECTCGKAKGHAGWVACLKKAVEDSELPETEGEA